MTEVVIRYNPYKVETQIIVDGKEMNHNNRLNSFKKERLQMWIEQLIPILTEYLNEDSYKIIFEGTRFDYEDILQLSEKYKDEVKIITEHKEEKGRKQKIEELKELVRYMEETSPFEELKSERVKRNFERTLNTEFEIGVIATMSSGKSTLINAFLGQELMPSKNEACTATIASIKNIDSYTNIEGRKGVFDVECFNKEGKEIVSKQPASLDKMKAFNENPDIAHIKLVGDIPEVHSQKMNLVLMDTPGPNNSRTDEHRNCTYQVIRGEDQPVVLYVMNGTQLETNDDNSLLDAVASAMKVGGKQSKDRFIFVVNKMDCFDPEKENISAVLKNVREYLEKRGIQNPNIYPVSAEIAKVIRMEKKGEKLTKAQKNTIRDADLFTDEPQMHLLNYAPLSISLKKQLDTKIEEYKCMDDLEMEALYHTGVPGVEAAINEYLEKYAKPMKIAGAISSFIKIIEEKDTEAKLQREMAESQEKRQQVSHMIKDVEEKINRGRKTEEFKRKIENLKTNYEDSVKPLTRKIEVEFGKLSEKFTNEIEESRAKSIMSDCRLKISDLQSNVFTQLKSLISLHMKENAEMLLSEYREYVKGIIDVNNHVNLTPKEVSYLTMNIPDADELISKYRYDKEEVVGERWVGNTSKKWYKPWTWFDEAGYYKKIYETRQYVDGDKLANQFLYPVRNHFYENLKKAEKEMKNQEKELKDYFKKEIDFLEKVLRDKINQLKQLSQDEVVLKKQIKENEEKVKWLNDFKVRIDNILEV